MPARRLVVEGRVQSVGFRPFVHRLAHRLGLAGWVRNDGGAVVLHVQGEDSALAAFRVALLEEAPPLARPRLKEDTEVPTEPRDGFAILPSTAEGPLDAHVPPDYFICPDCLRELHDPRDRRYRYPFINCTQCGPRYTVIERLPYDRAHTTLAGFPLCPACEREYRDPLDRRFHAEPTACPHCGPRLTFVARDGGLVDDTPSALAAAVAALFDGQVVAVKGVGGYHLMCDATSTEAVARLRERKPRPDKPLAVMYPLLGELDALHRDTLPTSAHLALLRDPMRPIVLVPRHPRGLLPAAIAPGLNEVGVMLPYSPLHHLLLEDFNGPLVATSGNVSGEPVLTENEAAATRLAGVADAFLHHDRPIRRPADDAVYRFTAARPRPLRLGRGVAPLELELPFTLPATLLATGGHMKAALALGWGNRAVISPHIGDMEAPRSLAVFHQVVEDLQTLYGVRAEAVACDAHPGYATTRWAEKSGLPVVRVFHHRAHAAALAGEYPEVARWLVFTWDGVGMGEDGTLWGGEALLGRPGDWRRVASFRPFRLPGGDRASREPWRAALALAWETGANWRPDKEGLDLLRQAWETGMNAPATRAVGRLFDAAAAFTGLALEASHEGQGPMRLEAAYDPHAPGLPLPLARTPDGLWETDWAPLVPLLQDTERTVNERAGAFHQSLARALLAQARAVRESEGDFTVGLAGGVFQNRPLTEAALALLEEDGFAVRLAERLPCNDGALCFGQLIETGS